MQEIVDNSPMVQLFYDHVDEVYVMVVADWRFIDWEFRADDFDALIELVLTDKSFEYIKEMKEKYGRRS